jgi:O-antigen ligase
MGLSSPLIGVGLGNYYDNLPSEDQKSYSANPLETALFNAASTDPHNIFFRTFAETGGVGLSAFILLLLYFLKNDLYLLKEREDLSKALIISFWTLFIFSVLNPSLNIGYLSLFWLLRVMVDKSSSLGRLS